MMSASTFSPAHVRAYTDNRSDIRPAPLRLPCSWHREGVGVAHIDKLLQLRVLQRPDLWTPSPRTISATQSEPQ